MLTLMMLRGLSILTMVISTPAIRLLVIIFGALEQDSNPALAGFYTLKEEEEIAVHENLPIFKASLDLAVYLDTIVKNSEMRL